MRADLHRLLHEHLRDGYPGLPLLAVPLRYDRILRTMKRDGEVTIEWIGDMGYQDWTRYVKFRTS